MLFIFFAPLSRAILLRPKNIENIKIGDIISYNSKLCNCTIVHRVINKGYDEKGLYFITKGDNINKKDPKKVYAKDVRSVVVAILY